MKYPGGKTTLLPAIRAVGPWDLWSGIWGAARPLYTEPFLGGGALYLSLLNRHPRVRAVLSDVNEDLIDAWRTLLEVDLDLIFLKLCQFDSLEGEANYYRIRAEFNKTSMYPFQRPRIPLLEDDSRDDARATRLAQFVYLNRRGFNGLVRYGPEGFSTPFGKTKQRIFHRGVLAETIHYLRKNAPKLTSIPFEASFPTPRGSMIYADPPYVPRTRTSFTRYSGADFGYAEHERLRDLLAEASSHSWFIHSNLDTPWVRDAYSDFRIHFVTAKRTISSDGTTRLPEREVIITGGPGVEPGRFNVVQTFGVPKVVPAE